MKAEAVSTTPPAIIPPAVITITLTMNQREASLLRTIAGADYRIPNLLFGSKFFDLMSAPTTAAAKEVAEVLEAIGVALNRVNVYAVQTSN